MKEKIRNFYEDNKETVKEFALGFARGAAIGAVINLAVTGLILNIGYWSGHPEKVLKQRVIDMIIKNAGE